VQGALKAEAALALLEETLKGKEAVEAENAAAAAKAAEDEAYVSAGGAAHAPVHTAGGPCAQAHAHQVGYWPMRMRTGAAPMRTGGQ
jgi:hypothetical protein